MKLLLASGTLPTVNGWATLIVLRAEVDDLATGQGIAHTAHGFAVPMDVAKGWLDPEARAILVLMSKTRGSSRIRISTGCSPSSNAWRCSPGTRAAPTGAVIRRFRGLKLIT
jgi:hypothetical protein